MLQLVLRILVDVFLVVGHDGFGDGLADGIYLGGMSSAMDAYADIDIGKFVQSDYEEGFIDLERKRTH